MKKKNVLSLHEETEKEAAKIEKEILKDSKLEEIKVSDEMEKRLAEQIQAYEKTQSQKKVHRHSPLFRRRVMVAAAVLMIAAVATSVTAVGSKSYLKEIIEKFTGEEEQASVINVEDMDTQASESADETQVYREIEKELGIQVREHALEYGVDPDNILTLGASAGGHLCASQAALAKRVEDTPDKICLCYPVISFTEEPHEGSAELLTGGDTSLRKMLSAENLVTESYPETFVWTCADDDCVPPSNAVRMGAALKKAHVRHELFVYPSGGHGCGLAFSKEAHDWSRAMVEFFKDQQ